MRSKTITKVILILLFLCFWYKYLNFYINDDKIGNLSYKVKNSKQLVTSSVMGTTLQSNYAKDIEKQSPKRENKVQKILQKFNVTNYNIFKSLLNQQAKNNTILLTFVDFGFVEMAVNLYLTSIKQFKIKNYIDLFISSDPKANEILASYGIAAVCLWNDSNTEASNYDTLGFGLKAIKKVIASGLALELGYNVIFTDVDIVFFKNPFPYLVCNSCDVIFQLDTSKGDINSGFYLALSTLKSLNLHFTLIERDHCWRYKQQHCFSSLLKELNLSRKYLPNNLFPSGQTYFDIGQRMFAYDNPCRDCILVHNNWIVSYSNKEYRFKELLLWQVDKDGYYSSKSTKYITYQNTQDFGVSQTKPEELNALKTAFILGHILNRIVILPKFFCHGCPKDKCQMKRHFKALCAAHVHYNMRMFDTFLRNKYREHVFLQNALVPHVVKTSISKTMYINNSNQLCALELSKINNNIIFQVKEQGASEEEFLSWISPYLNFSVIRFHTLYGTVINYHNEALIEKLRRVLNAKTLFK